MMTPVPRPLGPTRSLAILGLVVFGLIGLAQLIWATPAAGQAAHLAAVPADPEGATWPGRDQVAAKARSAIAEMWDVPTESLVLDMGRVRSDWIPGPDLQIDLRGTGRAGYWVVAARDGRDGLSLRVRAGRTVLRPTAAGELKRGQTVAASDVISAPVVVWGMQEEGSGVDPVGWEVKRRIAVGEVLQAPAVAPPAAVSTGRPVEIELRSGSVSIRVAGTALGTVLIGEQVYVRTATGERLHGTAVAPGRVVVESAVRVDR